MYEHLKIISHDKKLSEDRFSQSMEAQDIFIDQYYGISCWNDSMFSHLLICEF